MILIQIIKQTYYEMPLKFDIYWYKLKPKNI
jgi:hypothetical protein